MHTFVLNRTGIQQIFEGSPPVGVEVHQGTSLTETPTLVEPTRQKMINLRHNVLISHQLHNCGDV